MIGGRIEAIWGTPILDQGFTPVPNLILRTYRKLGIEHGEWGFLCVLFSYKHSNEDPFPSQDELTDTLCCGRRQIYKWTQSLIDKGYLMVGQRYRDGVFSHNVYDFKPLLDACLRLEGEKALPAGVQDKIRWRSTSVLQGPTGIDLEGPTGIDPEGPTGIDPEVHFIDPQGPINRTSNRVTDHPSPNNRRDTTYPQDRFGAWLKIKRAVLSTEQFETALLAYEWARSHNIDDVAVIWGIGRVIDEGAPVNSKQYYRAIVQSIEAEVVKREQAESKES